MDYKKEESQTAKSEVSNGKICLKGLPIEEKAVLEVIIEKPAGCRYTRMELVLRQFRHLSFHTGMLNGQTALSTGQFPMWVSEAGKYVDDGEFFGRYRKGKTECERKV